MALYSLGVPRLCGYHLGGTLSGISKCTFTNVGFVTEAGMLGIFNGALLTLSSGKSIVIEGESRATEDLRAKVTFTTQDADSFGGTVGAIF